MTATNFKNLIDKKSLKGRVAFITGSSRGIGRDIALLLAEAGCNIVVTGKSTKDQPNLPGTIFSVAKEVEQLGVKALPVQLDVRHEKSVEDAVAKTIKTFGRIDILINNAGALWWKDLIDTPMKRYDLINDVNARGTFMCCKAVLPYMEKQKWGHIINMSPPIDLDILPGKIGYCISKFGMTMIAHGLAKEYEGKGIAANALWPITMIESFATINFKLGNKSSWRKARILSDCILSICSQDPNSPSCPNGQALIDEEYLKSVGVTNFVIYRGDPNVEPPKVLGKFSSRPNVGKVTETDKQRLHLPENLEEDGFRVSSVFKDIQKTIDSNPKLAEKVDGNYRFDISKNGKTSSWFIDTKNRKISIVNKDTPADCILTMEDDICYKIMTGQLDETEAFFNQQLTIDGDMQLAMKLSHFRKQPKSKL